MVVTAYIYLKKYVITPEYSVMKKIAINAFIFDGIFWLKRLLYNLYRNKELEILEMSFDREG